MGDYSIAPFDVTCHVPGCENEGIVIRVMADPDEPMVTCGPCAQPITDMAPASE